MAERQKVQSGFRMRSTQTNKVVDMDPATAALAMKTFAPGSSLPMYEPIGPVPGFTFTDDGGVVATAFEPSQALEVARKQTGGKYPHRLSYGESDPAFAAAKAYRDDQILRNIGKNKGFGEVFGERMANVFTFGAYGALQDDNEEEAVVRAHQNRYNSIASTGGTFGGVALSLLFPYGAAAKALGHGAMTAGRASGLVHSAHIAAKAAKGPTNLLQAAALATGKARTAINAKTGSTFLTNYGGGLVGAAVAEAPLSLAIAAADIVDYNKDFTAQAVVRDAGALFLLGMGVAGVVGFPGAVFRSGAGAARRVAAGETSRKVAQEVVDLGSHAARRATYGMPPVKGAGLWWALRKGPFAWMKKKAGPRTAVARKLTGEQLEEYGKAVSATPRNLANEVRVTRQTNAEQLRQALKDAEGYGTATTATMVQRALRDTESIISTHQSLATLKYRTLPEIAEKVRFLELQAPARNIYRAGAWDNALFRERWKDLAKSTGPFAAQEHALAAQLDTVLRQTTADPRQITGKLLQARQVIKDANIGAKKTQLVAEVTDELHLLTNKDAQFVAEITAYDNFHSAYGKLSNLFDRFPTPDDFTLGSAGIDDVHRYLTTMEAASRPMGLDTRMVDQLGKEVDIFQKESIREGAENLKGINAFRNAVLYNEGAGVASALKLPKGQLEALGFGDDLLDAEIESVMGFKQGTAEALKYLTWAGSPKGGGVGFGGVLAYRAMTAEEKREEFAIAREILLGTMASPERMIATIGQTAGLLTATDLEGGVAYSTTLATAGGYLLQQMPRSSDPLIGPSDYSMQEIDSYLESIGALESPASVLASARDGSVSIEGVDAIRTVYPELYTDMILDLVEFMQTKDWDKINEAQKLGLDTFTGGALGVLSSYGPIQGPLFAQTPMQQQALGKNMQQGSPQMAQIQGKNNTTASQKVSGL